jgi:hypothetical protein
MDGSTSAYVGACRKDIPYPSVSHESVPSLIDNLVAALYGSITKSVVNRRVQWYIPCDPNNTSTINNIPRNAGEGLLCYIIRALNLTGGSGIVTVDGTQTLTNKTILATGSTTTRTLENRFADVVNVLDFGADPTGAVDSTSAFSLAVQNAPSVITDQQQVQRGLQSVQATEIFIPKGRYKLTSNISSYGKDVVWIFGAGAIIDDTGITGVYGNTQENVLCGRVVRQGHRITAETHYGSQDTACGLSVANNCNMATHAGVSGFFGRGQLNNPSNPAGLGTDSVGFYVENNSPALVAKLTSPTYTATSVSCSPAVDTNLLRVGMFIAVVDTVNWIGQVSSWAIDGSSINVVEWRKQDNSGSVSPNPQAGTTGTPTNGSVAYVNAFRKVWAQNSVLRLHSDSTAAPSSASMGCGYELDVLNYRGAPNFSTGDNTINGFSALSYGYYSGATAYYAGGQPTQATYGWQTGYEADSTTNVGFLSYSGGVGYQFKGLGDPADWRNNNGNKIFTVKQDGSVGIGDQISSSTAKLNFYSSGNSGYIDAAIESTGGAGVNYQANLIFKAGTTYTTGNFSATGMIYSGNTANQNVVLAPNTTANGTSQGTGAYAYQAINHNITGSPTDCRFINFSNGGTTIGNITQNGASSVAFNTSSDYRLKENIEPLAGALDRVSQLPVHRFSWKTDSIGRKVDGFIAHEVSSVVPEAVTGEKDAVDEEGNPIYQGIDQSKLVPLLTAGLKELKAIVDAQSAEIADLKSKLPA